MPGDLKPDDPTPDPDRKNLPIGHHALSELRKLLVPIVTALIAAVAASGFAEWRVGSAKDEAAEKIQESEQRAAELERLRVEIRKELLREASWDEVGAHLTVDEAGVAAGAAETYKAAMAKGKVPDPFVLSRLEGLVASEAQQIQAQIRMPPRPVAAPR